MAKVVIKLVVEMVNEQFSYLKSKLNGENRPPRTIMGKSYASGYFRRTRANVHQDPPRIKRGHDSEHPVHQLVQAFAYGPFYTAWDSEESRLAKAEAWIHVLRMTGTDENQTISLYTEAVGGVEDEARALYGVDDPIIASLSSDEFVKMMILDGCFLLQVALLVLGGSKQLNYPLSDPLFGDPTVEQAIKIRAALSSMFMVGNQIPLVVLLMLMNQSFFKNVLQEGRWEQPLDLERLVLFELLVAPMLDETGGGAISVPTASLRDHPLYWRYIGNPCSILWSNSGYIKKHLSNCFKKEDPSKKVTDLLHGLWLLVTGVGAAAGHYSNDDDDVDEEKEDPRQTAYYVIFPTVRSATELAEAGVVFKSDEGTKINGIRFRKFMFNAFLVLPRLVVDANKLWFRLLLSHLMVYETLHFKSSKMKVCEYMLLMRELIRSPEDVKLLAATGVIFVNAHQEQEVQSAFEDFAPHIPWVRSHRTNTVIRRVRDELNSYTRPSPFKKLSDVLSVVLFLTLIQTVYSVVTFHLGK